MGLQNKVSLRESHRAAELMDRNLGCSQALMLMALEAGEKRNPELASALLDTMSGLSLGMGQGFNCGALSGGCCVLAYCAGCGRRVNGEESDALFTMLDAFGSWFTATMTREYGGIDCSEIVEFDDELKRSRCPDIIAASWMKIRETLAEHGLDLSRPGPADAGATP